VIGRVLRRGTQQRGAAKATRRCSPGPASLCLYCGAHACAGDGGTYSYTRRHRTSRLVSVACLARAAGRRTSTVRDELVCSAHNFARKLCGTCFPWIPISNHPNKGDFPGVPERPQYHFAASLGCRSLSGSSLFHLSRGVTRTLAAPANSVRRPAGDLLTRPQSQRFRPAHFTVPRTHTRFPGPLTPPKRLI
jgi:hypothetical protein